MLPVREVAMMGIMDMLTDKEDWHKKVFIESVTEKWREEAMAIPDEDLMAAAAAPSSDWYSASLVGLDAEDIPGTAATRVKGIMSSVAFDYCIQELQSKARYFEQSGLIPTLDASATVIKSDVFISDELQEALRKAFKRLQQDRRDEPDWHLGSRDMVHPSMYPLVYGQTRVFKDEVVGVTGAISQWAGKGDTVPKQEAPAADRSESPDFWPGWTRRHRPPIPRSYWSDVYQWLPSNIGFRADGSVIIKSYINNLHPEKYPEIYSIVEKMVDKALVTWHNCLIETRSTVTYGPGRRKSRFSTPKNAHDGYLPNWDPSDLQEVDNVEVDFSQDGRFDWVENELEKKWRILRTPVLRDPEPFQEANYDPSRLPDTHIFYRSRDEFPWLGLREKFEARGLQIIVKMASIELTPENPEIPAGSWHTEGLLNERICATALYYLDSENITESSLSFRMHTSATQHDFKETRDSSQDGFHWLECNYGTSFTRGGACVQNYGSVKTPQGRLLAFPNIFQNRASSFRLADPTRPGHQRYIALWLVNPCCRIISTANVPPQQQDWWTGSAFGETKDSRASTASHLPQHIVQILREKGIALPDNGSRAKLPPELLAMVGEEFDLSTLSLEQAKEHRLKLMEERTALRGEALETWNQTTYDLGEH